MNIVLREYLDKIYIAYLDDIIIFSEDINKYHKYIYIVFEKLAKYKLRINLRKYQFRQEKVNYLGYIIGLGTIEID